MGASPSRGISIRNPEPTGKIIQITEDVAKRMTSRYGQNNPTTGQNKVVEDLPQAHMEQGILNVGSKGIPIVETVTAYEVRQEKVQELQQNDEFWTRKLKDLEARYIAAAFIAEGEFKKELEKLEKLSPKPKAAVCQDYTTKVAQCYKENPKQALKCSDIVREFAVCVDKSQVATSVSAA